MNNNEILVELSEYDEEWYQLCYTCLDCGCDFMADDPKFCPGCGKKIAGYKQGKITIYYGKGEKMSNEHPVCTNRCKFKEVFGEERLKGLDNVIKNTTSRGVANALSSFLTEEYKEGDKE